MWPLWPLLLHLWLLTLLPVLVQAAVLTEEVPASPTSPATSQSLSEDSYSGSSDLVVDLGYARFRGSTNSTLNVTSWVGMYYAASPEGQLRWAAPVDIETKNPYTKSTVYIATEYGPQCYQQSPGWADFGPEPYISENCLLLNVRKPVKPASAKLPVLFLIHGGGWDIGGASGPNQAYFTSVSRGQVIFVEIQYRLGGLGFLNNKEIREAGVANAGLYDQRAALGWVQRHIAAFGGDPQKVTIIGGSAGGGSVASQLQYQGGEPNPPFRAAIAEFPAWQTFHSEKIYSKQYNDILEVTKCSDLTCLRKLPFTTVADAINQTTFNAYAQRAFGYGDFYWGPSVDGTFIKELPHAAFAGGRFTKVPLLVDHDALEGLPFTKIPDDQSEDQVIADLKQNWPNANQTFFDQLQKVYSVSEFQGSYFSTPVIAATAPNTSLGAVLDGFYPGLEQAYNTRNPYPYQRQEVFGGAFVACPTRTLAASFARYKAPVWKLIFNSGILVHSAVNMVITAPPDAAASPAVKSEASILQAYYISFATDLNPNTNAAFSDVVRPEWSQYGVGANVMFDNFTQFGQAIDTDKSERCDFLAAFAPQLGM